ncbi:MAG TPA: Gfo/Idh/MocA family oxidoreductase [Afifellaceae bacterium]|nr:Gfo/Idh/MocA family oxidoreductase [Afifellaceae bacterium]
MIDQIRTGVIGVGNFGWKHTEKYYALPTSKLVAVADIDEVKARKAAERFGVRCFTDFRDLIGIVDAVSITVPTTLHYDVACYCFNHGVHALVEKPISEQPDHGYALSELAERNNVVLQVGHIERFSPTFEALQQIVKKPLYIECYRISVYTGRGTDVNVILDVMIHDIDMIMALVDSPVESVDAVGTPVVGQHEDIANTRVLFENGCVANVTASRISHKTERSMRIFQPNEYTVADFHTQKVFRFTKRSRGNSNNPYNVERTEQTIGPWDNLEHEIDAFLSAVANNSVPKVTGRQASDVVRVASMIEQSLLAHRRKAGL